MPSFSLSMQAPPPPPRGSGFDPAQPEELELWQLHQGLAREREYHHVAKRKAGAFLLLLNNVFNFARVSSCGPAQRRRILVQLHCYAFRAGA